MNGKRPPFSSIRGKLNRKKFARFTVAKGEDVAPVIEKRHTARVLIVLIKVLRTIQIISFSCPRILFPK